MRKLHVLIELGIDIIWALLATALARRGMINMGRCCLKIDDLAEPEEKLPHHVRTKLASAVGWQEGIRKEKPA